MIMFVDMSLHNLKARKTMQGHGVAARGRGYQTRRYEVEGGKRWKDWKGNEENQNANYTRWQRKVF